MFQIINDICPDVSPHLQVLAMGFFLGALNFVSKDGGELCTGIGVSPDTMLMDRHRAPAMTWDSICFGCYVDGVCAVGCDRPKVLAANKAVKVTLDDAGLPCSEIEADICIQAKFHRTSVGSRERNIVTGRLTYLAVATWSGVCCVQKQLAGDQVAKLVGHITCSCLLRRPALSLINGEYGFARTFGPRSGRLRPAIAQEFKWIASLLPLLTCKLATPWSPWVCAADASGRAHGSYGVTNAAATGCCAERWRFSAEEFISARRSALVELELGAQKASWLGVEYIWEASRVDLHPSLVGDLRRRFRATPDDRAVFENVPSTILQAKSAWCVLFGGVWRKPLEILRGEGKAYVIGLRHACWPAECLVKQLLFLLDIMALVLGASKGRGGTPNLNHTFREVCVIFLAMFTIPVCSGIASESNPADEPSSSKRYRPRMHSDVGQCGTDASESTPDLPSSLPKPRELPVKKRKLESYRETAPTLALQS